MKKSAKMLTALELENEWKIKNNFSVTIFMQRQQRVQCDLNCAANKAIRAIKSTLTQFNSRIYIALSIAPNDLGVL